MKNEYISAIVGAVTGAFLGGLITYLVTDRALEAQAEQFNIQLTVSKKQFEAQLLQQVRERKQDRLFEITTEVLKNYADVTLVLNRSKDISGYWYILDAHYNQLLAIGETRAAEALWEFRDNATPAAEKGKKRDQYYAELKKMRIVFGEVLAEYDDNQLN